MTNGDFQARVEFILQQQAELTSKVDALVGIQAHSETRLSRVEESFVLLVEMAKITDERLDTLTDNVGTLTDNVGTLTDNVGALTDIVSVLTDNVRGLTDIVRGLSDRVNILTATVESLAESQRHTDERLNALINVVDRYIGDGRNGGSQ